ncbi:hypothetical protein AAG747_04385 [Rapidithrix thailandica]|uniref:Uncharacterized protein n=1 Tax=Rapidithrix thailandica TaxID=413964 RepID=A0AAW9S8R4_9BACT
MKKMSDRIDLYNRYYTERNFDRAEVFLALREKYQIQDVLYPGSFVHITPAFIFPHVVFVDNDKNAKRFFNNLDQVKRIIEAKKDYTEEPTIEFLGQNYQAPLPLAENKIDLLISHYAGIISQPCKQYLRVGGLLLVNNSHADAGVAYLDKDYALIATIDPNRKSSILETNLHQYFIPQKQPVSINDLIISGKGIGYTKTADLYLFQRIA